jgi:hypothetical protein
MVGYLPLASVFDTLRTCCSSLSRLRSGPEQSSGVRNKKCAKPEASTKFLARSNTFALCDVAYAPNLGDCARGHACQGV